MLRRITIVLAVLVAAVMSAAALASDTSGTHFNKRTTTATVSGSTLTVDFTVSGLGNNVSTEYIAVTGDAACVNGGGKHPSAANKQGFAFGTTAAVENGSATGSLSGSPAGIHCGAGQTLDFSNVVVHAAADQSAFDAGNDDASLLLIR